MSDETAPTCAVWYLDDHGRAEYELASSDEEAATRAASIETYTDGSVLGLQRADGSTVAHHDWAAFNAERATLRQRRDEAWAAHVPPPTRQAKSPFGGYPIDIETSEPDWLGDRRG